MESRSPFTLNSTTLIRRKTEILDILLVDKSPLDQNANQPANRQSLNRALTALSEVGIRGLTPQSLMTRLSTVNSSESYLLELMASSIAYWEISASRMQDHICLQIEHHFLFNFAELLEKELVHSIGVLEKSVDEVRGLLKEDAGVAVLRVAALERRQRLETVWQSLVHFRA